MEKLSNDEVQAFIDSGLHSTPITKDLATDLLSTRQKLEQAGLELSALREQARWIPVVKELPDDGKWVLVGIDGYSEENWIGKRAFDHWEGQNGKAFMGITHWMPLPPLPGGEE